MEDFVEIHICKSCVVPRPHVLRVLYGLMLDTHTVYEEDRILFGSCRIQGVCVSKVGNSCPRFVRNLSRVGTFSGVYFIHGTRYCF